jgi:hypothetical protein
MAQSFVIFDFGKNEEAAQQARLKLEGWRQAFHLDKKMQYKFERNEVEKKAGTKRDLGEDIRVVVRLSFSDHEKLTQQRWLERLPTEEPFKDACPKILLHGEVGFDETAELFESVDRAKPQGPR